MQPDPIRAEETLAWMKKSRKDLWRAESVLTLDPPDTEDDRTSLAPTPVRPPTTCLSSFAATRDSRRSD